MVVLWHEVGEKSQFNRGSHFDLMLEAEHSLWTWAVEKWPLETGEGVPALKLPDHRLAYLEYEGPVSGNRGIVSQRDRGIYRIITEDATELSVLVTSQHWSGRLTFSNDRVTAATATDES